MTKTELPPCPKCKQQTLTHRPINQTETWGDMNSDAKVSVWCTDEDCGFTRDI